MAKEYILWKLDLWECFAYSLLTTSPSKTGVPCSVCGRRYSLEHCGKNLKIHSHEGLVCKGSWKKAE